LTRPHPKHRLLSLKCFVFLIRDSSNSIGAQSMRKMAAASQQLRVELDQMMVLASNMRPATPGSPPKDDASPAPATEPQGSVPPSPYPARKFPQIKEPGASTRGRTIVKDEVVNHQCPYCHSHSTGRRPLLPDLCQPKLTRCFISG
jgi:hypothetical protein